MTADRRPIHSLIEAHLCAAISPCHACAARGFTVTASRLAPAGAAPPHTLHLACICARCESPNELAFDITRVAPRDLHPESVSRLPFIINPTAEPSAVIDVAQWLTLHRMAAGAAETLPDAAVARAVRIEARQCVAEALKHYAPGNDVPPPAAFFTNRSRQRFRDHPDRFARDRLLQLVAALPKPSARPAPELMDARPFGTRWWMP
jgi:hypothetical protein